MRKCVICKEKEVIYIGDGELICVHCGQMYGFGGVAIGTASDKKYWGMIHEDPANKIESTGE